MSVSFLKNNSLHTDKNGTMNLHIKVVRVFKFIVKYKLFVMFVCYVVSMYYLLENKNKTREPTVNRKGHVPLQNYINEKTIIQRLEYKHGITVPSIRAANMDKSSRSKTRTILPLYKTYTSSSKSSDIFPTSATSVQTKPHTNKIIKDNKKADRTFKFNNSTFQRITNKTRKVSSVPSRKSLLHNTTYSKTGPPVPLFQEWLDTGEFHCENESELEGYPKFMRIKNIIINRKFGSSPPGRERVSDVLRQKESMEFVKMRPGFFEVKGNTVSLFQISPISYSFQESKVLYISDYVRGSCTFLFLGESSHAELVH